jgi:hypothetical protein
MNILCLASFDITNNFAIYHNCFNYDNIAIEAFFQFQLSSVKFWGTIIPIWMLNWPFIITVQFSKFDPLVQWEWKPRLWIRIRHDPILIVGSVCRTKRFGTGLYLNPNPHCFIVITKATACCWIKPLLPHPLHSHVGEGGRGVIPLRTWRFA